jgi:hypothetical protein
VERVKGIEPSLFAWEAKVLPLNDTRLAVWLAINQTLIITESLQNITQTQVFHLQIFIHAVP